jgi:hypothetical protein
MYVRFKYNVLPNVLWNLQHMKIQEMKMDFEMQSNLISCLLINSLRDIMDQLLKCSFVNY